jgi:hypothetical protein
MSGVTSFSWTARKLGAPNLRACASTRQASIATAIHAKTAGLAAAFFAQSLGQ